MIKKSLLTGILLVAMVFTVACGASGSSSGNFGAADGGSESGSSSASGEITVISREDGSGTRSAFVELFGVHDADKNDLTTVSAETTNNTAVMMTSVEGDPNAIGYISLGSLNDTVKALKIDGADATVENVANGVYAISRPFNIVTLGEVSPSAQDFINFILSDDGQDVIEAKGYIRQAGTGAYSGKAPTAKIAVSGSSSVSPAMEALREAYIKIYPSASLEIQTTDSSSGINDTISGISDIGMASRALKDSEASQGLASTTIAMDGIAVIVNNGNALDGLTKDQVKGVYTGEITTWEEL